MIKIAHIMPTSYLTMLDKRAQNGNVAMALAHLVLASGAYKEFYNRAREKGCFVMLDNSAFELGSAISDEDFIKAIEIARPNEIVLPDVLFDSRQTMSRIRAFLEMHAAVEVKSFMAVPHGNTLDEYIQSYVDISKIDEVTTLGIGTIYNDRFKDGEKLGREIIFDALLSKGLLAAKTHHLLGLGDSGNIELSKLAKYDFIRSCDSSAAYVNARAGNLITNDGYLKDKRKVEFEESFTENVAEMLIQNMTVLEEAAHWKA